MIDWVSLSTSNRTLAMRAYRRMVEDGVTSVYICRFFGSSVLSFTGRFWAAVEENRGLARMHGIRLQGFSVTRVDFAWDVVGAWMETARLELLGNVTTIFSPTGITLYSGSRESSRFLRVYDKRSEIKAKTGVDTEFDLTRVELETKGEVARVYLDKYQHGEGTEILDDVVTRYGLSFLGGETGQRICVAKPGAGAPLKFVQRFYHVIGKALLADPRAFVEALELQDKVTVALSPPPDITR
jgi:hypothetical protein